jgi:hypothetical protein
MLRMRCKRQLSPLLLGPRLLLHVRRLLTAPKFILGSTTPGQSIPRADIHGGAGKPDAAGGTSVSDPVRPAPLFLATPCTGRMAQLEARRIGVPLPVLAGDIRNERLRNPDATARLRRPRQARPESFRRARFRASISRRPIPLTQRRPGSSFCLVRKKMLS